MKSELTMCTARPEDHAEFARFFVELGHDDPIPDPARWCTEMMPHTFFLEENGAKVAYAFVEPYGERGYIRHVVVAQSQRGRGVGRSVMDRIAANLRERGASEWELNVRSDNASAIHLYESVGMRAEYSTMVMRFEWSRKQALPKRTHLACASDVEARHDPAVERAFQLPDGMVARLRSFEGHVLAQLVDPREEPIAFARFDPAFPGAFPFRVQSVELVRPLLDVLESHAPPKSNWLQLVIENDAPTAEMLIAKGAQLRFEILHLRGSLPR
ncbi:MAG: GNAT family N-acetyltransferase [Planctomycetota bacterium]|nr:GNAT family N-acetyltransferase [Planctomycetota bacterium]